MARKEYKLTRPDDSAVFTMLLEDEDVQKYRDAKWGVEVMRGGKTVRAVDLAAPAKAAAKAAPAKAAPAKAAE